MVMTLLISFTILCSFAIRWLDSCSKDLLVCKSDMLHRNYLRVFRTDDTKCIYTFMFMECNQLEYRSNATERMDNFSCVENKINTLANTEPFEWKQENNTPPQEMRLGNTYTTIDSIDTINSLFTASTFLLLVICVWMLAHFYKACVVCLYRTYGFIQLESCVN